MKLRKWLMSAFFVVMLLPVIAFGTITFVVRDHDKSQALEEYVAITDRMQQYERQITHPRWYRVQASQNYKQLEAMLDDSIILTLYRADGYRLFSTQKDDYQKYFLKVPPEELYSDLYSLEKTPRSFQMKQPVFHNEQLIGFYELHMERESYVEQISNAMWQLTAVIILFFALLYGIVWWLVKRKLIQPMRHLMNQMSAFAKNEKVPEWKYTKQDEMGILIQHFGQMRGDVEAAKEAITKEQQEKQFMVASLSHDLKTPLTSIQAYLEALDNGSQLTSEEITEYRAIVWGKVNQMRAMLDDLTLFAALRSSKYPTKLVEVESEELFDMLFSGYDALCNRQGVHLMMNIQVNGMCQMDPNQMTRLTDNLVSNALRHTPAGKFIRLAAITGEQEIPEWLEPFQLRLRSICTENDLCLVVMNEGSIIPSEQIEGLLKPFVQGEQSRPKSTYGFGLGLNIAQEIVRRHHGQLFLWSEAPCGTVVLCQFPIHPYETEMKEGNT